MTKPRSARKTDSNGSGRDDGLHDLLVHPLRRTDNEPESLDTESYEDWVLDHRAKARFYLCGFNRIRRATRETEAKYYYKFAAAAMDLGRERGWAKEFGKDSWRDPPSYNQFRKAITLREPMFLDLAAQVFLGCECALVEAAERKVFSEPVRVVLTSLRILPATSNIDGYNSTALSRLREEIPNYDATVLKHSGQNSRHLLTLLAEGNCVTRKTARAIRQKTLDLVAQHELSGVDIGDVRANPGKKRLGRKNATAMEIVELDDLSVHRD